MPEGAGTVKEQRNAELVLARLADARLMMAGRPSVMVATLIFLAVQVVTGLYIRGRIVPRGWEVAAVCGLLLVLAVALPAVLRAGKKSEPQWARAAAVHEQSLSGRLPAATLGLAREIMAAMTAGTRWRGSFLYISRCTEEDDVHYATCCAAGTYARGGRLLVILGEHLAAGPPELAVAVLGHERRHVSGWRLYLYSLAAVASVWGLAVAGWAVPWPALLLVAAALRVVTTALFWTIEISCDVGSARDTSAGAMLAAVDYQERTRRGARALWPSWKRRAVIVLTCLAWPDHPPFSMRRAAVRALAR